MATETVKRIYELQVKLAADSLRQLQKIGSSTDSLDKKFTMLRTSMASALGNLAANAIQGGISSLIGYLGGLVDELDRLNDVSQKLDISVESLSALGYAAKQSGSSMEELQAALTKLAGKMQDAAAGGKDAVTLFKDIGVNIKDAEGNLRGADVVFKDIAARFESFKDGAGEAALALDLFGRSGAELVQFLNQGKVGIDAMEEEARQLGATISDGAAAAAADFNDNMDKLKGTLAGASAVILQQFLPQITDFISQMLNAIKVSDGLWDIMQNFFSISGTDDELAKEIETVNSGLEHTNKLLQKGAVLRGARGVGVFEQKADEEEIGRLIDRQIEGNKRLLFLKTEQARRAEARAQAEKLAADIAAGVKPTTGTVNIVRTITDTGSAAKEAKSEFDKLTASFNEQLDSLSRLGTENDAYLDALYKIAAISGDLNDEQRAKLLAQAEEMQNLSDLNAKEKKHAELMEEGKRITESLLTPMEQYRKEVEHLNDMYHAGAIEVETWSKGIDKANEDLAKSAEKVEETASTTDEILKQISDKVDGYAQELSGALVDFATATDDARISFSEFATSVLKDLLKMLTQMLIMEPIISALKSAMSPGGFKLTAKGDAFQDGKVIPFAKGGIVGRPTLFPMAGGVGLMGEAGPEAVMPLKRNANGELGVQAGSAAVVVNVYNESQSDVTTQSKTDKDGRRTIDIFIRNAVKQGLSSGAFDGVLATTFGINRQGAR